MSVPANINGCIPCRSVTLFERVSSIGQGAFGVVFKAKERETGEMVALKKVCRIDIDIECIGSETQSLGEDEQGERRIPADFCARDSNFDAVQAHQYRLHEGSSRWTKCRQYLYVSAHSLFHPSLSLSV